MTPPRHHPLRVLVVEEEEPEGVPARELLRQQGQVRLAIEWHCRYHDALLAIRERRHDAYLIDAQLREGDGAELAREAFTEPVPGPVILLEPGSWTPAADPRPIAPVDVDRLHRDGLTPAGLECAIRHTIKHHRALKELVRSEERYALAVRAANDGIWDWDLIADRIHFSPRWHAILGLPAEDRPVEGDQAQWFALVHPADLPRLRDAVEAHLEGRTPHLLCEHRMRHADGGWRWVVTRGLANRDIDGTATRMAGSLTDVTERHAAQSRLEHDALHDRLTGLPNRHLFMDRVHQCLLRATRDPDAAGAVLSLDVDRFMLVNDSIGHGVGDRLLVALAERIGAAVRPGDTVARLGGDEFAVLLEGVPEPADAYIVADRVLHALREPFEVDGHELFVRVSIGIALGAPGMEAHELLRHADIAMASAKREGRGRRVMFQDTMRQWVVDRLARENELRQVIESSELQIHYQPIVELSSGEICGLEALARWPAGRPPVPPGEFITIAEEAGMIGVLGHQVLQGALAALGGWRRDGLVADHVCMSVNLSGRQLEDPALAELVQAAIEEAALPPRALKLEITESTLIGDSEARRPAFSEVCAGGVGLHLDDFGTGYSSLWALHRLPVDALKIDRSFVAGLVDGIEGAGADAIIRTMVALAHSLGLPVIAEGIESSAQLRRLRALGCEFGQGFLFSPALSEHDSRALLSAWRPAEVMAL